MDDKKVKDLANQIKSCKDYKQRLRLNALYLYYKGNAAAEVADMLCMSRSTINNYINEHEKQGKNKDDDRGGKKEKLTEQQSQELEQHLENKTYLKSDQIIEYIRKRYCIIYSKSGMKLWLSRHGFVYKKPKSVPAKLNVEEQERFVTDCYYNIRESQGKEDVVLFMDSVHPAHQTQAVHGWIRKGQEVGIKTTAKQPRVHFIGGLDIDNPDKPFVVKYDKIDGDSIVDFFNKLKEKYKNKNKITIICDNAGYHKGKRVKEFLEINKNIEVVYLPTYSPNLNPIERLWKIMREFVLYNKYYKCYKDFVYAVNDFFENTVNSIRHVLLSRINDNFQVIQPKFVQL